MNKYFNNKKKLYMTIVEILCEYKGLTKDDLLKILKDKNCKYLFFLLIKKYECFDLDILKEDLPNINKSKITNNMKRAEKKLLFNRKIRDMYFEAENLIDKIK
jgi:hypothetical protein